MRWFERGGFAGDEDVRRRVYMTSMTTCFPGRTPDGRGDRRPGAREVALCSGWLDGVLALLRPRLVLPIGTLALARFLPGRGLEAAVGRLFDASGAEAEVGDRAPLLLPLPHPSGQSRWLNDSAHIARLEQRPRPTARSGAWAESG